MLEATRLAQPILPRITHIFILFTPFYHMLPFYLRSAAHGPAAPHPLPHSPTHLTPPFHPSPCRHSYLTDCMTKLPMGLLGRLVSSNDTPMSLAALLDSPPWVRRVGKRLEKWVDDGWKVVEAADRLKLTQLDAQVSSNLSNTRFMCWLMGSFVWVVRAGASLGRVSLQASAGHRAAALAKLGQN